jgi:hypothetical protein
MRRRESDMKTSLAQGMVRGLLAFLLLGLGGCGGGGGGGNYAGGGIGGSGISVGAITAIGSVEVNGVEFDTTHAVIVIGGDEKGVGDQVVRDYLHVGKVVVVEGSIGSDEVTGTASSVSFDADVAGSVESIDRGTRQIVVLDQLVAIDENAVFGLPYMTFDDLAVDDLVEVSGLVNADGTIQATYIGKKPPANEEMEVKGVVRQLNTSARTFKIRNLTVHYDTTTELPDGEPQEGQLVQVRGLLQSKGKLEATKIQLATEAGAANADRMDVDGFVTEVISSSVFNIGQQEVRTDEKTTFKGGSPTDIKLDVKLEVKGRLVNHVLAAEKITFR